MTVSRAIITGGAGFVGSAVVSAFSEQIPGCEITILDRRPSSENGSGHQYIQADITSPSALKAAFEKVKPDIVVHTAGFVPPLSERYSRRLEQHVKNINVGGTRNVVEVATASGCKCLIYTSSCCAVTDDLTGSYANIDETWPVSQRSSIYGESKAEAEELVLAANSSKMATCILRPCVIFGEGDQQLVPPIHACIAKGETPYRLGKGMNLWDTVYVGNVAEAHALAAKNLLSSKSAAGEIFFIQNNEPISFRDFSLAVWKEFGHLPPFEVQIPEGLGWLVGWVAEVWTWLSGTPATISRGSVLDACATRYASGDKAKKLLGYEPRVSLEDGIKQSCKEFLTRPKSSLHEAIQIVKQYEVSEIVSGPLFDAVSP